MTSDLSSTPERAGQRPSVGWASLGCGPHFMLQPRKDPEPQNDVAKVPIRHMNPCEARRGGRALRGGPLGLYSARGSIGVGRT